MHAQRELNDTLLKHMQNLYVSIMLDEMHHRTASTIAYAEPAYRQLYL